MCADITALWCNVLALNITLSNETIFVHTFPLFGDFSQNLLLKNISDKLKVFKKNTYLICLLEEKTKNIKENGGMKKTRYSYFMYYFSFSWYS